MTRIFCKLFDFEYIVVGGIVLNMDLDSIRGYIVVSQPFTL